MTVSPIEMLANAETPAQDRRRARSSLPGGAGVAAGSSDLLSAPQEALGAAESQGPRVIRGRVGMAARKAGGGPAAGTGPPGSAGARPGPRLRRRPVPRQGTGRPSASGRLPGQPATS